MKIALVFPESTFLIDPMVYPPLGLWYLGAQLEIQGHECDFFDLSEDELPNDGDYDQIWMSATSAQMHSVRKHANTMKNWKKTATVIGGAAAWASPAVCTTLDMNVVISGEADQPDLVKEIVDVAAEALLSKQRNVLKVYGTRMGRNSLDVILPPLRRWSSRYNANLEDQDGTIHRTSTMFTSRGCPMACAFCESGRNGVIWDRIVRYEPIETVEAQLREIRDLGFTGVMFYDDILPLNKPRMLKILELLKKYDFIWRCFVRTDVVTAQGGFDYLRQMADGGLVEVLAGVESADNRIKDGIYKGTTIEDDTNVLYWCKELGIKFKASFILGLPGESQESMEATRDWILKHRPDRVDVNTLIPFPGTPITNGKAGEFDLEWTEELPEEFWYKGPRDNATALTSTSNLTSNEIREFHNKLIDEIKLAGIPY